MALNPNELFSSASVDPLLRAEAKTIQPKKFAAGSGTLTSLTPVSFNSSNNNWEVWSAATKEVTTITSNATPATAGTFTLTVNGETTATIAYNATAAAVQAAIEALGNIQIGDVTAVATSGANLGAASAVVTLTWGGRLAGTTPVVSIATGGLTGNVHVLAEATAGVDSAGTNIIRGFVWPDDVVLDSDEEVLGNVMLEGKIHYADIVLPSGETEANLKAALQSGLRDLGIIVQGLIQVR